MIISLVYLQPRALITPTWARHSQSKARATWAPLCTEEEVGLITAPVASAPAVLPGGSRVAAGTAPPVTQPLLAFVSHCGHRHWGGCTTQLGTDCTQSRWLQPCGHVCVSWRETKRFYGQNKALWPSNLSCILLTSFPTAVQTVLVFHSYAISSDPSDLDVVISLP